MSSDDDHKKFIQMADSFIDLANKQCDKSENSLVNASFLYGAARFSAFLTASMAESQEKYDQHIDDAVGYYTEEFQKMLREHLEQYSSVFKEEPKRYEHLMKEEKKEE